ncbi:MAG: hypothetical protein EHM61_17050 [Acidobacteria bacterium]|nr:MAG: hypothetical protein EHM61_17050 [Acidobacteriota bacterium]
MSTPTESRTLVCRRLRWKGMFVDVPHDPTVPSGNDIYCWCSQTMTCLGPDGKVADRDNCRPGRGCHETF